MEGAVRNPSFSSRAMQPILAVYSKAQAEMQQLRDINNGREKEGGGQGSKMKLHRQRKGSMCTKETAHLHGPRDTREMGWHREQTD